MTTRRARAAMAAFVLLLVLAAAALAHPGSAIGVTPEGRVFFVDTGAGVFTIASPGSVVRLEGPAFHWFAVDPSGAFRFTGFPSVPGGELRAVGTNPTIILSSDLPVTVAGDAFYVPERTRDERVQIVRVAPSGERAVHATLPAIRRKGERVPSINGIAPGPDGSLYYTEDRAVRKIDARGRVTAVATVENVPRCEPIPGIERRTGPYLRGLAVGTDGTAWVAASGCGVVLKITPRGAVTTALRTSSPWSPTAIAVSGADVFVLEYLHTASDERREWLPRVRKIARDGSVETLVNTAPR